MARNAHKLITSAGTIVGRSGKLRSCNISVSGDRVWSLREVGVSGNIIYKVDAALTAAIHQDLDLTFKGELHATVAGTTGELQIIYE